MLNRMLRLTIVASLILTALSPVFGGCPDEYLTETIGPEGEWATPGYPLGSTELDCTYFLYAPIGWVIDLTFTDVEMFQNPHVGCIPTSVVDPIQIYSRTTGSRTQVVFICGSWGPYNRYVKRDFEIVVNIRDREGNPSKFAMEWYTRKETSCNKIISGEKAEWGILTSPGYPGMYYSDYYCVTTIIVCKGDVIQLTFEWIDIEEYMGNCDETITVYDHASPANDYRMGSFCGQQTPYPLETKSNALTLVWSASIIGGAMGYKATYKHKYIAHRFDVVKDMTDDEKIVVYMGLYNKCGYLIPPSMVNCEPDWTFTAIATNLEACDLSFPFHGYYNDSYNVVKYVMDMPKGNYKIEFTATAHAPNYKLTRSYTVGWCSRMLEEIKHDYTSKTVDVDFIIEEMYDYFSYEALEKLGKDLRHGFQLSLKTVYVEYVTLTRDPYGYIHASVQVRGQGLSTAIRPLCSVISSAYPFKFCRDEAVMPIKHGRTIMVGGEKYGFGTDKKCRSSMFNTNPCW